MAARTKQKWIGEQVYHQFKMIVDNNKNLAKKYYVYAKAMINECSHENALVKLTVAVICIIIIFFLQHSTENERSVVLNICGKTVTTTIQVDINVVSQETQFKSVHMITIAFEFNVRLKYIKMMWKYLIVYHHGHSQNAWFVIRES